MNMMNKYKFIGYNPSFPNRFIREKRKLKKILKNAKIEHIGSSAVKGLGGKGILDIAIAVSKKDIIKTKKILEKNKYVFKQSGGTEERLFFKKYYKYSGKTRLVHLQLSFTDSQSWKNQILVRDFLKVNKKAREDYACVKNKAVKFAKGDGKKYREYKHNFLQNLIKRAKNNLS